MRLKAVIVPTGRLRSRWLVRPCCCKITDHMSPSRDPLLSRAAAAIDSARNVRSEMQRALDSARLQRLERELAAKILKIKRIVFRDAH